ncbi:MAG: hypothetical protein OWU84_01240 [Firmicutes bacterium]|nr:hypothetical protein [Bacillota bacterium]
MRDTTWRAYAPAAQSVIDQIGAKSLNAVTALDIQGVYTALLTDGRFKPATIRITHNVCRQVLNDAVDWSLIPANPGLRAIPLCVPRPTIRPPTPAQAQALLKAADGHPWRVLWYTIALTGCRRGEALGMQWQDIDWKSHALAIQRMLTGKAARRTLHEPKIASGRRVVALRFLMGLLQE